jgi:hypothetical protein
MMKRSLLLLRMDIGLYAISLNFVIRLYAEGKGTTGTSGILVKTLYTGLFGKVPLHFNNCPKSCFC